MRVRSKLKFPPFLLILFILLFSSCEKEDEGYYYFDEGYIESIFNGHYYDANKTWRLCSRSWHLESYDRYGNYYEEILTFYKERRGRVEYYRNGYFDGSYHFGWYWDNLGQMQIFMDYGYGDYEIFHHIRVSTYELSGIINGIDLYYTALYY